MRRSLPVGAIVVGVLFVQACRHAERHDGVGGRREEAESHNPLGANAGCYICHMTFVEETLSATHLAARITCDRCHGPSEAHANDEDIGATPPDIIIQREKINASCRTCHETHDVAPEKMIARWRQRGQSATTSRPGPPAATCTDCHGHHKISAAGLSRRFSLRNSSSCAKRRLQTVEALIMLSD